MNTVAYRVVRGGANRAAIVREPVEVSVSVLSHARRCYRCRGQGAYRRVDAYKLSWWVRCKVCDGLGIVVQPLASEVAHCGTEGPKVSPRNAGGQSDGL